MAKYSIVGARPKNATNHAKSEFDMYKFNSTDDKWHHIGWQAINFVSDLMRAGHEVSTAKIENGGITIGAPAELELRITKNGTNFKISQMPDS